MLLPVCLATNGKKPLATNGTLARCSLTVWTLVLLLLHCSLAAEVAKPSDSLGASREIEPGPADATGGAGSNARAEAGTEEWKPGVGAGAVTPARPREPAALSPRGHAPPRGERGPEGRAAFMLVDPLAGPLSAGGLPLGLLSKAAWARSSSSMPSKTPKPKAASQPSSSAAARAASRENQTAATQTLSPGASSANLSSSNPSSDAEEPMSSLPAWDLPTIPESLLSNLGDNDITLPDNITSPFSTHQWNTTAAGRPGNSSKQSPTSPTPTSSTPTTSPTTPTSSTSTSTSRMHLTPPLAVTTTAAPPPPSTGGTTLRAPLASPTAPGPRHTGAAGSRQPTSVTAATPPPLTTPPPAANGSRGAVAGTGGPAPTSAPPAAVSTQRAPAGPPASEEAPPAGPAASPTSPVTVTTTTAAMATSPPTTTAATTTTTPPTTTAPPPTTTATPTTTTAAPTTTTTTAPTTTTTTAPTTTTTAATTTTPAPTTTSTTTTTTAAATTSTTSRTTTTAKTRTTAAAAAAAAVPERTTPALPTTTEPPPSSTSEEGALPCNITEKYWLKTVLSIQLRRNRLDLILKQNLAKGLSHALQRALNDTNASAQMEQDACSPYNVTLAYYVTSGKTIYIASLVVEALNVYGFDKLLSDIRQHTPLVKAVLVPVATWLPAPSVHLQLKTVLRFIGPTDNVYSCSFVQMLEQRLENAFDEAQDKVLETYSRLTVEIQSVSQVPASPSVAVVYVVRNQDALLNGTISSGLLNQLTAELVGYFLFYPPLLIAEPLEYHNLNTSAATKSYWVITVIQDVDTGSLETSYQSFASLMEQRLAELFLVAGRQGAQVARVRRASSVGGYTVQMVSMRRLAGPKDPAEMTYYAQLNGEPILGTAAAKTLSTLDSQTMALTLGYFVQVQAEPVVKTPPGNLWLLAVMTPVVLLLVVLGMVAFILCKRNRVIFKTSAFRTFKTRSKTSYRREGSYHHQPVQGFDYAKKHIGRPGDETTSVTKETLLLALPARDAPLSLERKAYQDGTANKRPSSTDMHKGGRLPSEEGGSMSSDGSGKLNTGKSSSTRRTLTAGSVVGSSIKTNGKEELHKRGNNDPYEDHSGSLRLITIKPMTAQPTYSYPSSSSHSQDSVVVNGESNHSGLKQKSDIEHYRNKLRQKARRKGYGEFSLSGSGSHAHGQRDARHGRHDNGLKEPMTAEEKRASFAGCHKGYSQREPAYWSRQSLSSSSPLETEMDLLLLRERSRRGIRNNGYDAEAEPFEETNVDRLMTSLGFGGGGTGSTRNGSLGVKGHRGSDSSTLSSQPSIDEVRSQMHMLLGNAFSLGPPDHDPPSPPTTSSHHRYNPHAHTAYNPAHSAPYCGGVTSAPGTMNLPCGGRQRSAPGYGDMHQCSLPKPGFRFTQLPDMGVGPPPPLIPSRPGPPPGTSVRRSTPDVSLKPRLAETPEQHNGGPYPPPSRTPFPAVTVDQSISSYSGNPMTAVYAISANRPGYSDYYVMSPPASYRSPSWMSYPPEQEDLPRQWSDTPNSRHLETIC
ncbi:UPF0606 protein KIAA1549L [Gadus chalcogrammus]|uniref:UPF0606 protein KIAA1549L n=1 Tax=Gadus chalcogrammus TaxID=1042646 RepID=UPI0024C4B931|nr:UPF0606 protein KIAA1549L [Gadus chalcogrammus]